MPTLAPIIASKYACVMFGLSCFPFSVHLFHLNSWLNKWRQSGACDSIGPNKKAQAVSNM